MSELHHELDVLDEVLDIIASIEVSEETFDRLN
jgi:hypothetical protein